jgi:hypothetical protein
MPTEPSLRCIGADLPVFNHQGVPIREIGCTGDPA